MLVLCETWRVIELVLCKWNILSNFKIKWNFQAFSNNHWTPSIYFFISIIIICSLNGISEDRLSSEKIPGFHYKLENSLRYTLSPKQNWEMRSDVLLSLVRYSANPKCTLSSEKNLLLVLLISYLENSTVFRKVWYYIVTFFTFYYYKLHQWMTLYEVLIRTHYWMILGDIIVMMKSFTVTTILTLDLRKLEIQFTCTHFTSSSTSVILPMFFCTCVSCVFVCIGMFICTFCLCLCFSQYLNPLLPKLFRIIEKCYCREEEKSLCEKLLF